MPQTQQEPNRSKRVPTGRLVASMTCPANGGERQYFSDRSSRCGVTDVGDSAAAELTLWSEDRRQMTFNHFSCRASLVDAVEENERTARHERLP